MTIIINIICLSVNSALVVFFAYSGNIAMMALSAGLAAASLGILVCLGRT